ncbi:ATP-binding cassette domain-containing protein [Streptomyces rubellomurinus]|uniref:ABC transporter n=1 Tax=Streptomyces rubellomurinus (strain ATCC 31215) TaxID=359131 RepID=A0A0F2TH99_STRR3|nr:ABC transporter ATP-binding protein [Streptomyces rubellomurinus]KJS61911.1 ABC transporter [Streptomyces rubellomurinus]
MPTDVSSSRQGSSPKGLRRVLRLGRRWSAVMAVAVTASTGATLALPAVLAHAVDAALTGAGTAGALPLAATLAALAGAEAVGQYAGPRISADTAARLRADAVRRVLAARPLAAHRLPVGDVAARLTGSAPQAALAAPAVIYTATQLAMAAAALVALAVLAPTAALAFLGTAPLGYAAIRRQLRRTATLGEGYQRAQADIATRLLDAVSGSRSIAAAGALDREIARVLRPVPELSRHGRELWDSQRRIAWCSALLAPVTQLAVLAAAGAAVAAGSLSVGGLLAALGYTAIGLGGFGAAQSLLDVSRARAGADRLAELLDAPVPAPGTRPLPSGDGALHLCGVTVDGPGGPGGPGGPVLDRLDLAVPGGGWLAVVGADDAATSALAALATGLLDPDEGTVTLDGVPLAALRPDELRAAVSCAFADPALPGRTVEDAIGPGLPAERVRRAARAARADEFVRRLPDGYRTPPAEAPFSGGERQRLGIARALAHDGRLLVLDDATSSLDAATEAGILHALREQEGHRTRLVVTRRAAVAAHADQVAWLQEGRIRALATHEELSALPGYRAVFDGEAAG